MSIDPDPYAPIHSDDTSTLDEQFVEHFSDPPIEETPIESPLPITAEPVKPAERVGAVDIMRGVALLGILAMNINNFGWPGSVYSNPMADPGVRSIDIGLWAFNHVVFDTKMMTTFSMLFGAGLVLMSDRADGRGAKLRGIYYRRIFWLLVIGCIHAYLIWEGDVLVMYAQSGLLLYPFRHKTPKTLLIVGTILCLLFLPLFLGLQSVIRYAQRISPQVAAEIKAGQTPTWFRGLVHRKWVQGRASMDQVGDGFRKDMKTYRGGYIGIVKERAGELVQTHTFGFLFGFWYVTGRMLIGMGLMKLGVFSAQRSRLFYQRMMLFGYGFGMPLVLAETFHIYVSDWNVHDRLGSLFSGWMFVGGFTGIPLALGHIGLVMIIIQSGTLQWLTSRLAATGRMALSNYLFDSILCTTLFYGYGFGLYGKIHRVELFLLVLAIWAFQLCFSPIWLRHFRYGPAEWLWRSLTYWKFQPMRRQVEGSLVAA